MLSIMVKAYLEIAEGLEQAAAGYRKLAGKEDKDESKPEPQVAAEASEQMLKISVEDVRAVLATKSQDGKTQEVKALLLKFGASRLSEVKPESYRVLLTEAKRL
jgi:hypothetical protein